LKSVASEKTRGRAQVLLYKSYCTLTPPPPEALGTLGTVPTGDGPLGAKPSLRAGAKGDRGAGCPKLSGEASCIDSLRRGSRCTRTFRMPSRCHLPI
jgi:hypothetical protein